MAELIKAINGKKLKELQDLLKKAGCKPNEKVTDKGVFYTPVHAAVKTNTLTIVDALLTAKGSVEGLDNEGATPLHWAALHKDGDAAAITRSLLKKNAKTDALNAARQTPWHVAAACGSAAVITELSTAPGAAGLESTAPGQSPIAVAVLASQHTATAALLQAGAKLSTQDASGLTPLMHLIALGRLGDAQRLLDLGHDCGVTAQGTAEPAQGLTALTLVIPGNLEGQGSSALITTLLEKGASPDVQAPNSKDTPITWAITNKHSPLAIQLIKKAKQLGLKNGAGKTALDLAIAAGADDVVSALIGAGADLSDAPKLLKVALEEGKDKLLAELIRVLKEPQLASAGVTFKSLTDKGLSAAALAHVTRFDKQNISDNKPDADGNTMLHSIAESGAPYDLMLGLMRLGLGPNTVNKAGDTPLHVAARAGHVEVCRALLDGGSDALKRNAKNRRAREQPKIPDVTRDFLLAAEDAAKEKKLNKQSELWDDKMKAAQTESACLSAVL